MCRRVNAGVRRSTRERKRLRGPWYVKEELEEESENVQQQPQQVPSNGKGKAQGKKRCRAATVKGEVPQNVRYCSIAQHVARASGLRG